MEKRITKAQRIEELKGIVANLGRLDLVEFLDHEAELLKKKSNSKTPTKNQVANENLKDVIVKVLTNATEPMTITDITNANDKLIGLSNQKISALLIQLIGANLVVRTSDKKKAYFSIVR